MSVPTEQSPFNETDFRAIESAVLETEKGRWFLNEFGRRNRVADTQTLLGALGRLERNLTSNTEPTVDEHVDVAALSNAIDATRADIRSVRNDMLEEGAEIPSDKPEFSHLSENAHQVAADLIATAEALQGTVNTLRKDPGDPAYADTIDGHVHNLFDGGWRQDVLAQRIAKAMGLLEHLDHSLKALAGEAATTARTATPEEISKVLPAALTPENLRFFEEDADLFNYKAGDGDSASPNVNLAVLDEEPEEDENKELYQQDTAVSQADDKDQQHDSDAEPPAAEAAAPQQPAAPAADMPEIEPNIVVIRRGKSAGAAPDEAESETEAPDLTASETGEITPPEADVEATQDTAETSVDELAAADRSGAETAEEDLEQAASEIKAEEQEDGEPAAPADRLDADEDTADEPEAAEAGGSGVDDAPVETAADDQDSEKDDKVDDAISAFADMAATTPDPAAVEVAGTEVEPATEDDDDDKERIVVIKRTSSDEAEIPFADYLGVDPVLGMPAKTAE